MKIFNWVHRRFNHKDGLSQTAKKSGLPSTANEKQFLLQENNGFSSNVLFDGWKGGILAIGTFGYNPLKDDSEDNTHDIMYPYEEKEEETQKEQVISEVHQGSESENDDHTDYGEEEEEEDEEEDVNPLMYAAYAHDYEGLLEMKGGGYYAGKEEDGEEVEYGVMMKRERTTLAELFSADSDEDEEEETMKQKKLKAAGEMMMMKQRSNNYKSNNNGRLSFAKKIIGEDAHPAIHKLNRLMKRMLNRKIHPDMVVPHDPHKNPVLLKEHHSHAWPAS